MLERLATLGLEILLLLAREELADLVLRAGRRGEREPVARRAATGLRCEDLDAVSAAELVVQRDDAAVHLRTNRAMADVGVHGICEVDRCRACGQRLHRALRREDKNLLV